MALSFKNLVFLILACVSFMAALVATTETLQIFDREGEGNKGIGLAQKHALAFKDMVENVHHRDVQRMHITDHMHDTFDSMLLTERRFDDALTPDMLPIIAHNLHLSAALLHAFLHSHNTSGGSQLSDMELTHLKEAHYSLVAVNTDDFIFTSFQQLLLLISILASKKSTNAHVDHAHVHAAVNSAVADRREAADVQADVTVQLDRIPEQDHEETGSEERKSAPPSLNSTSNGVIGEGGEDGGEEESFLEDFAEMMGGSDLTYGENSLLMSRRVQQYFPVNVVIVSGDGKGQHITELETIPLVKSILQHATCDLNFHFVTEGGSAAVLQSFFERIKTPRHRVNYSLFELDLDYIDRKMKRRRLSSSTHHSGPWGVAKFFLVDILPVSLKQTLVMDTDYIFGADICELWSWGKAHVFNKGYMHASHIARGDINGTGICSCMTFFNLEAMRAEGWTNRLLAKAVRHLPVEHIEPYLNSSRVWRKVNGDQQLNVAMAKAFPEKFRATPKPWSLNGCQDMHGVLVETEFKAQNKSAVNNSSAWNSAWGPEFWGAVHFNCDNDGSKYLQTWKVFREAANLYRPEWFNGARQKLNCFRNYPPLNITV